MNRQKVGIMVDTIFMEQARHDLSKHELTQALWELKHIIEFNMAEYSRRKIEARRNLESVDIYKEYGKIAQEQKGWRNVFNFVKGLVHG